MKRFIAGETAMYTPQMHVENLDTVRNFGLNQGLPENEPAITPWVESGNRLVRIQLGVDTTSANIIDFVGAETVQPLGKDYYGEPRRLDVVHILGHTVKLDEEGIQSNTKLYMPFSGYLNMLFGVGQYTAGLMTNYPNIKNNPLAASELIADSLDATQALAEAPKAYSDYVFNLSANALRKALNAK